MTKVAGSKTSSINVRIYPEVREEAERIFSYHGLSIAEAITVFLNHACHAGGFPFELKRAPYTDAASIQAFNEAMQIENDPQSKAFYSVEELLEDLENDDD